MIEPLPNDDARLAELVIRDGALIAPLSPTFSPDVFEYDVEVSFAAPSVTVEATPRFEKAAVAVDGVAVDAGALSAPIPMQLGDNEIEIAVEAETGERLSYRVRVRRGPGIRQQGRLAHPRSDYGDTCGYSLAVSGDVMVVGCPNDDELTPVALSSSGTVLVFAREGDQWVEQAVLKAESPDSLDKFGHAVAVDGDIIAVGAPGESSASQGLGGDPTDDTALFAGAVFIYERSDETWSLQTYLKASNAGAGDGFGSALALDGTRLAVGSPHEDSGSVTNGDSSDNSVTDAGAVYLFEYDGSAWSETDYIKASPVERGPRYGAALALVGDDLIVGASDQHAPDLAPPEAGAVWVYSRAGGAWEQTQTLRHPNPDRHDFFGDSVAVAGDWLVIGAPRDDSAAADPADNAVEESGAVFVYKRGAEPGWQLDAVLKAASPGRIDRFGSAVSIAKEILVVGAPLEDSAASGVNGDAADDSMVDSGGVYLFLNLDASWQLEAYVKPDAPEDKQRFGASVVVTPEVLAVGAIDDGVEAPGGADGRGAAYVFR